MAEVLICEKAKGIVRTASLGASGGGVPGSYLFTVNNYGNVEWGPALQTLNCSR